MMLGNPRLGEPWALHRDLRCKQPLLAEIPPMCTAAMGLADDRRSACALLVGTLHERR